MNIVSGFKCQGAVMLGEWDIKQLQIQGGDRISLRLMSGAEVWSADQDIDPRNYFADIKARLKVECEYNDDIVIEVSFVEHDKSCIIIQDASEAKYYCYWSHVAYIGKVEYRKALRSLGSPCVLRGKDAFMFSREEGYCCAFAVRDEKVVVCEFNREAIWGTGGIVSRVDHHGEQLARLMGVDAVDIKYCLLGAAQNKEQKETALVKIFFEKPPGKVAFMSVAERALSRFRQQGILVVGSEFPIVQDAFDSMSPRYGVAVNNKVTPDGVTKGVCVCGVLNDEGAAGFSVVIEGSAGKPAYSKFTALCYFSHKVAFAKVLEGLASFCGVSIAQAALIKGVKELQLLVENMKSGSEGDTMSDASNTGDGSNDGTSTPGESAENNAVVVKYNKWPEASLQRRVSSGAQPPAAILNDIEVVRRFVNEGVKRPATREELAELYKPYKAEILDAKGAQIKPWAQSYFAEVFKISNLVNSHARKWAAVESRMVELNDQLSFMASTLSDYMNECVANLQRRTSVSELNIAPFPFDNLSSQMVGSMDELFGRMQTLFEFACRDCLVMAHRMERFAAPIRNDIEPWLGDAICLSNPDRWEWVLYHHRQELMEFDKKVQSASSKTGSMLPLVILSPLGSLIQALGQNEKNLELASARKAALKTIKDNKELIQLMAALYRDAGSLFDISFAANGALRTLNSHWEGLADIMKSCVRECSVRYELDRIHIRCLERMVRLMAVVKKNAADVSEALNG